MESGLKHIHYLFIAIYLITYLSKSMMLLMGKTEALATFKKKTIISFNDLILNSLNASVKDFVKYFLE